MRTRRLIGPIFAVLATVAGNSSIGAQTPVFDKENKSNPSHIPVPFNPPASGQFADFLRSRDHARQASEAHQQLKDMLEKFEKLSPDQNRSLFSELYDKDGRRRSVDELKREDVLPLLERLRPWLERNPGIGGDANQSLLEELDALKEWVKQSPKGEPVKPRLDLPLPSAPPAGTPPEPMPSRGQPERANVPEQPIQPSPEPEPSRQERREELKKNLADWWDRVKGGPLGNSETLRELGRKFSQPFTGGGGSGMETEGLLEKLPRLGNYLPFKDLLSRGLPSFPKPQWPSAAPSVGAPGGFQAPDSGAMMGLVWIGVAVLALALIWKLLATQSRNQSTAAGETWRLGPWPVDPAQVATRQDLIRAFEYLSLLLLGPAARSWNHRVIAARLSEKPDDAAAERRRAAEHLAVMYEKARYAPLADALPDGEVREARRDLCLLAGVAAA